jgi:superfamily II DNA or RNA helicase
MKNNITLSPEWIAEAEEAILNSAFMKEYVAKAKEKMENGYLAPVVYVQYQSGESITLDATAIRHKSKEKKQWINLHIKLTIPCLPTEETEILQKTYNFLIQNLFCQVFPTNNSKKKVNEKQEIVEISTVAQILFA